MSPKPYDRVTIVAARAVEARLRGLNKITLGSGQAKQQFDLGEGGMCARFVRQVHEVALSLSPFTWRYRGDPANDMISKLERGGKALDPKTPLLPGDIIGWASETGPGHIAIYLGDWYGDGRKLIAENTSAKRGAPKPPGTKVTQLKNIRPRTHAFRLA